MIIIFASLFADNILAQTEPPEINQQDDPQARAQQKINELANAPKVYFGTLTDLTESTYELRSRNGEILLVSYSQEDTDHVRVGTTQKDVEATDAAIGDYVIAMGYINDKQVLEAKRILLTEPVDLSDRNASYGKVSDITRSQITITINDGSVEVIQTNKNTTYTSFEEGELVEIKSNVLEEGNEVIVVTQKDENKLIARNIHLVTQEENLTNTSQ